MFIHLFGATTPSGEAFGNLIADNNSFKLFSYSRNNDILSHADLVDPGRFKPGGPIDHPGLWVSFAPIWLFAPFLEYIYLHNPDYLGGLSGVIACSSSSASTKRFAFNSFDKDLVDRLITAEDLLSSICRRLDLPCTILRPTMIYGRAGSYSDNNLSRLISLMRLFPLLPIPCSTGYRQPIHATQLASLAFYFCQNISKPACSSFVSKIVNVGGDSTLTYYQILQSLQKSYPPSDQIRSCFFLRLPNRIFYILVSPLFYFLPNILRHFFG